ncbi:MAG: gamma-glutamylcyclotransferase family protein [Pseudomonadota bacterium]
MASVFGYGSLVNHNTHIFERYRVAELRGWRREWVLTSLRPVVFLSARPCPNSTIWGLAADVRDSDWAGLDERERGYDRHAVDPFDRDGLPMLSGIQVYSVSEGVRATGGKGTIILSYLDVVVEGYLEHFGEAGVTAFFDTTDGWDTPVWDDRDAPVYPRHRIVSDQVRAQVDSQLARLSAVVKQR